MVFSFTKNITLPEIKIGNNIKLKAGFTKFLGIYIDTHLTYVTDQQLRDAIDLSDNTMVELVSVGINNWLGVIC